MMASLTYLRDEFVPHERDVLAVLRSITLSRLSAANGVV
jgi:hypothetical protein